MLTVKSFVKVISKGQQRAAGKSVLLAGKCQAFSRLFFLQRSDLPCGQESPHLYRLNSVRLLRYP